MTTKGNIITEMARTISAIEFCKSELRNKLTNGFGMDTEAFENELTKGYIEANGVLEVMDELKNEVSKLEMLTNLISE